MKKEKFKIWTMIYDISSQQRGAAVQAKGLKHAMQYPQQLPKAYKIFPKLREFQIYHALR